MSVDRKHPTRRVRAPIGPAKGPKASPDRTKLVLAAVAGVLFGAGLGYVVFFL